MVVLEDGQTVIGAEAGDPGLDGGDGAGLDPDEVGALVTVALDCASSELSGGYGGGWALRPRPR